MSDSNLAPSATRWSSARRFVIPTVAERVISATLAIAIAGAGVGIAFIPGVPVWVGLIVAVVGSLLGVMLVRASERTIAATITRVEIDRERLVIVRWNGGRLEIPRTQFIESALGEWRSPSRPGVPYAAKMLTIHWRDENAMIKTCRLIGPWRPDLAEVHNQLTDAPRSSPSA